MSTCHPMSTSATKVFFQPVGPRPADSHHRSAHIHPFVTLGRAHGVLSNTGAIFIFSQRFPLYGFVADDDQHGQKHEGGTEDCSDDRQP